LHSFAAVNKISADGQRRAVPLPQLSVVKAYCLEQLQEGLQRYSEFCTIKLSGRPNTFKSR